jgi:hypothetical protein
MAHDRASQAHPEAVVGIGTALEQPPRHESHSVETVRREVEESRQQRQCADDRHDRDGHARDTEAPDERQRHGEQEREPDRDGGAAEDHGPARRLHRPDDRLRLVLAGASLLAVAVDHEQRVVDGDSEPDERDELRHVGGELHHVGEDPDHAESRRDRGESEREGNQERERPEDEDEYQERDRDRDQELASLQVFLLDRLEIVLDRRLAGHIEDGAWNRPERLPDVVDIPLRVGRLELRDDGRARDAGRDRRGRHERRGRNRFGRPGSRLRESGQRARDVAGPGDRDDVEGAGRPLAEMILEDLLRPPRVRSGKREPVR